jgi:site-specific recombinase XerD
VRQKFRDHIAEEYALSSCNSMIASVNCFFRLSERGEYKLKGFRMQRELYRPDKIELTKEEYRRLLEAARQKGNERLYMIMLTLGSTGIRISELPFITIESLDSRRARVSLKGKSRTVILPGDLCHRLAQYADMRKITSGSIFVTRSGRPVDRSNILHDMKRLCKAAKVNEEKVFPHNFRHLFAVTYYKAERDLGHLADILGHSNINTTRIYTAETESVLADTIEKLGLLL